MLPELPARKVQWSRKFSLVQLGRVGGGMDELRAVGINGINCRNRCTINDAGCTAPAMEHAAAACKPPYFALEAVFGYPIAPIQSRKGCQSYFNRHTIRFGSLEFAALPTPQTKIIACRVSHNLRICMSSITNFLMGRLDPSARFGRTKTWHGTPIALQNDRHFRNFAGIAVLCP